MWVLAIIYLLALVAVVATALGDGWVWRSCGSALPPGRR